MAKQDAQERSEAQRRLPEALDFLAEEASCRTAASQRDGAEAFPNALRLQGGTDQNPWPLRLMQARQTIEMREPVQARNQRTAA